MVSFLSVLVVDSVRLFRVDVEDPFQASSLAPPDTRLHFQPCQNSKLPLFRSRPEVPMLPLLGFVIPKAGNFKERGRLDGGGANSPHGSSLECGWNIPGVVEVPGSLPWKFQAIPETPGVQSVGRGEENASAGPGLGLR